MKMKDIWARRGIPNASSWIRQWLSIYWLRCIHTEWKFWLSGGSGGGAPAHAPQAQKFSISCSSFENLAKSYVGAPCLEGWHPRKGNPGFAPVTGSWGIKCTIYIEGRQRSMKIFAVTYSLFRKCKLTLRVRSHYREDRPRKRINFNEVKMHSTPSVKNRDHP